MAEPVIPDETAEMAGGQPVGSGPRVRWSYAPWVAMAVLMAGTIYQLRSQGRLWWCACGQLSVWSGNTWSSHNSQHLVDPYAPRVWPRVSCVYGYWPMGRYLVVRPAQVGARGFVDGSEHRANLPAV